MTPRKTILRQLVAMSRWLGDERRGLTTFTEGNTSAGIGDGSFYVKESGTPLGTISREHFVALDLRQVLKLLADPDLPGEAVARTLSQATLGERRRRPSLETVFHAYLLSLPGVKFVGHTHPIAVNAILCSQAWKKIVRRRITPEEVVCCGIAPACVEYAEPGIPLARRIRTAVEKHFKAYDGYPKAILMRNHGLIAIGSTPREVESITAIWDKTAKVLAGAFLFGGPHYLSEADSLRLCSRPDIAARRRYLANRGTQAPAPSADNNS